MRHWAAAGLLVIAFPFAWVRWYGPARLIHRLACKVAGEPNRLED